MRLLLPLLLATSLAWPELPAPARAGLLGQVPAPTAADTPEIADVTRAASPAHIAAALRAAPELRTLRTALERTVMSPGWRGDRWSVLVVSLEHGDTLFSRDPGLALAPASNMKLFTSAAALHYLGPEFRYATYLLSDGRVSDGALHGDLILYGTGDPTISGRFLSDARSVWDAFADSLVALGVKEVRGAVVGDGSYFGGTEVGPGWRESYMSAWYAAPSSALSFNENVVTLWVRPAAQAGWRPELRLLPGGEGIAIVNQATTVAGGSTRIQVERASYDGPIVVRGQIARGSAGVWRQVTVADPPRYAAATLREALEARGIRILGGIRSVERSDRSPVTQRSVFAPAFDGRPPLRVVAVHRSPPLRDILAVVNQRSHNMVSEQVLRTMGRLVAGDGRKAASARLLEEFLHKEVGATGVQVVDGSGLSPLNRATAGDLIALLDYVAGTDMAPEFEATLPAAGDRQLRRMLGSGAQGNLRAKTGTIDRVSSLSGYVTAANGERLAFAIVSNEVPSTWRAKRIEDAIGVRLASFTRGVRLPLPETGPAVAAAEPTSRDEVYDAGGPAAESAGAESAAVHVVRPGDTFDALARRYGTTVAALRAANPGVQPRRLRPGMELRLP